LPLLLPLIRARGGTSAGIEAGTAPERQHQTQISQITPIAPRAFGPPASSFNSFIAL
jgi:hypothetical protein